MRVVGRGADGAGGDEGGVTALQCAFEVFDDLAPGAGAPFGVQHRVDVEFGHTQRVLPRRRVELAGGERGVRTDDCQAVSGAWVEPGPARSGAVRAALGGWPARTRTRDGPVR